jgi:osmoprotectant transport system permease protein
MSLAIEILQRSGEHLLLVAIAIGLALLIALPLSLVIQRRPRWATPVLTFANTVQTIPSLAIFGLLLTVPLLGGIGMTPAVVALTLYALLPLLRGILTGLSQVPAGLKQAGRALGLSQAQVLRHIEAPLPQRGACTGNRRLMSMPIPGFNRYGLLPDGVYGCTMSEVEAALAWNEQRRRLTESLQAFIRDELLDRFTTIPPLVLDGSYVTSEEHPANINLVIELQGLPSDQQWEGQMLYVRNAELFGAYKIDMRPSLERLDQDFVSYFRSWDPRKAIERELDCNLVKKGLLRLMS